MPPMGTRRRRRPAVSNPITDFVLLLLCLLALAPISGGFGLWRSVRRGMPPMATSSSCVLTGIKKEIKAGAVAAAVIVGGVIASTAFAVMKYIYARTAYVIHTLVKYLKAPELFDKMGIKPSHPLLEGPPGCDKTLVGKATGIAAGVPFYQMAGSEFVQVLVHMSSPSIRNLSKRAKVITRCKVGASQDASGNQEIWSEESATHNSRSGASLVTINDDAEPSHTSGNQEIWSEESATHNRYEREHFMLVIALTLISFKLPLPPHCLRIASIAFLKYDLASAFEDMIRRKLYKTV